MRTALRWVNDVGWGWGLAGKVLGGKGERTEEEKGMGL